MFKLNTTEALLRKVKLWKKTLEKEKEIVWQSVCMSGFEKLVEKTKTI